nr:reverse transcriptase domain-containing protein [Tanacetum cinerariifolium]
MRFPPSDNDTCHSIDIIDLYILNHVQEILPLEPFDSFLFEPINLNLPTKINSLWDDNDGEQDLINQILENLEHESKGPLVSPIHVVPKKGESLLLLTKTMNRFQPSSSMGGGFALTTKSSMMPQEKIIFLYPSLIKCWNDCLEMNIIAFLMSFQDFMEAFMDDLHILGNSFDSYLNNLSMMLARCEETNLVLNWEKCHFMVRDGIVLGHKISKAGIEVDKAKVDVITKLPYPTNIKGIRSFLRHAGFYRRFIKDFSKIAWPMTQLLMKKTKFVFFDECIESFDILRSKLMTALVIISPNWDLDFKLIKTMNDAQEHYTTTEKELLAVVYAFDKFRLENPELEELYKDAIRDSFPDEHLMVINIKEAETDPWMTNKAPIRSTPFRIVYRKACHLPLKMEHKAYWALKEVNVDLDAAGKHSIEGGLDHVTLVIRLPIECGINSGIRIGLKPYP